MTDLMQCLYDYTTDTGFTARLSADRDYRQLTALTERLGGVLRQKLSGDSWDTLEKYQGCHGPAAVRGAGGHVPLGAGAGPHALVGQLSHFSSKARS